VVSPCNISNWSVSTRFSIFYTARLSRHTQSLIFSRCRTPHRLNRKIKTVFLEKTLCVQNIEILLIELYGFGDIPNAFFSFSTSSHLSLTRSTSTVFMNVHLETMLKLEFTPAVETENRAVSFNFSKTTRSTLHGAAQSLYTGS
jgi:hypothetical protein